MKKCLTTYSCNYVECRRSVYTKNQIHRHRAVTIDTKLNYDENGDDDATI